MTRIVVGKKQIVAVLLLIVLVSSFTNIIFIRIVTLDPHVPRRARNSSSSHPLRRIHQTWKSHNLPPRFQLYSHTWRTCFPAWKYKLWSDQDNRDLIRTQFPWFLETYDSLEKAILKADAVRYFLLYLYGGVYADLDTDCLRPFEHLLANYSLVLGGMEGDCEAQIHNWCVQNSFIYSVAGHPVWMAVAHEMMRVVRSGMENKRPEVITGPVMMVSVFNRTLWKYTGLTWKVYPPINFNPYSWHKNAEPVSPSCKALNDMTMEDLENCRKFFHKKDTYVVQYHTQTWGFGKVL